jgi:hypothetical protein
MDNQGRMQASRTVLPFLLALLLPPLFPLFLLSLVPVFLGGEPAILKSDVERDLCALDADGSAEILVAGDSRARYNIDPSVLERETGLRSVNIGNVLPLGGDLSTLVKVLRRNPAALAGHPVLIASVTLEGINDMGYANAAVTDLFEWTPRDHLRAALRHRQRYLIYFTHVFLPSIKTLLIHKWKGEMFRCGQGVYIPPGLLRDKGFEGQTGRKSSQDLWAWPRAEADYLIDGGRRRSFEAALRWLSTCPAGRVVVVNGPMDTAWLRATDGPVPLAALERFQGILADAAKRYPGMTFLDWYPDGVPGLEAEAHFNDQLHLNREGAEILTRHLAQSLGNASARSSPNCPRYPRLPGP